MSTLFSYKDKDFNLSHNIDLVPNANNFKMHTHSVTEIYYFISGRGVFHIEGSAYTLEPGDLLIMKPSESHYIEIDTNYPYERMVLNFNVGLLSSIDPDNLLVKAILERKPGKLNLYRSYDFRKGSCAHYWQKMMSKGGNARINLVTGLIPMLEEIYSINSGRPQWGEDEAETPEYRIIHYINENISNHLSLDAICERFFISKSQLCRIFKKSTGSTIWQYITIKRLVKAQQMLLEGEHPTHIYARCGFNEYSVFYRAYIKYFQCAPTQNNADE